MTFFTRFSMMVLLAFMAGNTFALQQDSAIVEEIGEGTFVGDTLLDLNRELRGVKEIVFPKGTVVPNALSISEQGVVVLKADSLLKGDKYMFELKAISNSEEVYIVDITVKKEGNKYLVTTVSDKIDMATGFRAEGKIYVVVAVSMILFLVIVTYLFLMERKLNKIKNSLGSRAQEA